MSGPKLSGQAVRHLQVGGLGSVCEGQGEQGCGGGRRGVDRAVRGRPGPESVQDLEPAVVGLVFPAAGEGRGDPQGGRQRGAGARSAYGGRPGRPDGGPDVSGGKGGADLSSGLLRVPAGQIRVGRGRDLSSAVLAQRLGDRSRHPEVLRHRALGSRGKGGRPPCSAGAAVDPAVRAAVAASAAGHSRMAPWWPGIAAPRRGRRSRPLLANLFMHYAFDAWMAREFPDVAFERYCDDAVVHCGSEAQARQVRDAIAARMEQVGLQLHPDKTRIVYCKDADRRGDHEVTSFVFLGLPIPSQAG